MKDSLKLVMRLSNGSVNAKSSEVGSSIGNVVSVHESRNASPGLEMG